MNNNYNGLRSIGKILQVLSWIALVLGVIAAITAYSTLGNLLPNMGGGARLGVALVVLLGFGVSNFFQLYIIGGLLGLFTDMAAHTVNQNAALDRLAKATAAAVK
ncbi:MAG: hypothetical protein GXP37_00150, partial [Chloroflexi bacterium]|nr:hypothetical protein [Chloroflexota bacterium]